MRNAPASADARFREAGLQFFERGWLSSNNVLFASSSPAGESVLVDTGYASHAAQTVALVRHALGGGLLGRVINTHLHSDHLRRKPRTTAGVRLRDRRAGRRGAASRRVRRS